MGHDSKSIIVTQVSLEQDIVERIRLDFAPADADVAIKLLDGSDQTGRLARCIVIAANGSLESLKDLSESAKSDYRDVIVAGEYTNGRHVRDLRVSFLIDDVKHLWIGDIAAGLYARGLNLISVESRPAPAALVGWYLSDKYEGIAKFSALDRIIAIERTDGKWRLRDNQRKLEIHGLNRSFADSQEFRDAVLCYLVAER